MTRLVQILAGVSSGRRLHPSLQVEQLAALHPEMDRVPDELEQQSQGQAVVGTPGAGDETSAGLTDRLKDERPRHRAGIVAEDKGPLRLDSPHDKAILGLRRLREDVADLDPLKLREDPVRARDT